MFVHNLQTYKSSCYDWRVKNFRPKCDYHEFEMIMLLCIVMYDITACALFIVSVADVCFHLLTP